MQHSF